MEYKSSVSRVIGTRIYDIISRRIPRIVDSGVASMLNGRARIDYEK